MLSDTLSACIVLAEDALLWGVPDPPVGAMVALVAQLFLALSRLSSLFVIVSKELNQRVTSSGFMLPRGLSVAAAACVGGCDLSWARVTSKRRCLVRYHYVVAHHAP